VIHDRTPRPDEDGHELGGENSGIQRRAKPSCPERVATGRRSIVRGESGDESSGASSIRNTLVNVSVGVTDNLEWHSRRALQRPPAFFHSAREGVLREEQEIVVPERMEADLHPGLDEPANVRDAQPCVERVGSRHLHKASIDRGSCLRIELSDERAKLASVRSSSRAPHTNELRQVWNAQLERALEPFPPEGARALERRTCEKERRSDSVALEDGQHDGDVTT